MELQNNEGIRGLIVTIVLWVISHITLSNLATFCTIASAMVTIYVNLHKHFSNGKDKSKHR